MATDFRGKTVVITGAASGLGAALTERFVRAGARIAALDIDADGLTALEARVGDGADLLTVLCDVTREDQCTAAMSLARDRFGGVDLLVNNAGITHRSSFGVTAPDVIRRVMAVNFDGAVHCTRAALPELIQRRGMVIAISSVAGFAPLIARTGYAASKHALAGFMESLRAEVTPLGVRVLVVYPGFIATAIGRNALDAHGRPIGREQEVVGPRSDPGRIADRIVRAAAGGRQRLRPDWVSRSSWWLWRLAPGLYHRVMYRRLRRELDD